MKRRGLIFLLLLIAGTRSAFAQPEKPHWEMEAGMCVINTYDHKSSTLSALKGNPVVKEIDTENDGFTTPTFLFGAGYVFSNKDIAVFFSTFSNYSQRTLNGGPYPLDEREFIVHLMPEFRYYYLSEQTLRVYLSIGVGARYRRFNEVFRGDTAGYGSFIPTFQFSPVCVSMGTKFSFIIDVGFGRPYLPLAFKLSYRFL